MHLTLAQQETLRDIRAGLVSMRNCGTGAWRIDAPGHPGVVDRLISLKLASWEDRSGQRFAVPTADGELALRGAQQ